MAISDVDIGAYLPFASAGGTELWTKLITWAVIYGIAISVLVWVVLKGRNKLPAWIFVKSGSGYRIKNDSCKFVKVGEIDALWVNKEKQHVHLPPQACVFLTNKLLGRGERVLLMKDDEGGLHYMNVPDEGYGYETVVQNPSTGMNETVWVPFLVPENRNMKEWFKNITRVIHEKLQTKKWYEALAPYATIALVGIVCIIMVYLAMNKLG
jgi:hypothetical protein